MKRSIIIIILTLLVLAGAFGIYWRYIKRPAVTPWDLVPLETVAVYESSACVDCLNKLRNSPIVRLVREAAFAEQIDSLDILRDFVLSFQQPTLVSLHVTRKDNFDFIFFLPHNPTVGQTLKLVERRLEKVKGLRRTSRVYDEVEIHEVAFGKNVFSWVMIDDVWVGSFTPVLIEDVVRTYHNPELNFRQALGSVYTLPRIKNDGGNLYLHLKNLSQWFSLFTAAPPSDVIRSFGQSALFDVKISEDNKFVLNGFSLDSANRSSYILSAFSEQTPVPFQLRQYVSNRTVMLASYGVSDGGRFAAGMARFGGLNRIQRDSLARIAAEDKIDFTALYKDFSGELGMCWMESKGNTTSKILMLQSQKGVAAWLKAFDQLSDHHSRDTVFFESYAGYNLRELPLYRLPEKLFAPLVTGFDNSYYTSVGNTLLIAEELEELKKFLDDLDKEETWGKSVSQNRFIESTLLEANISLYINTPRVLHVLSENLQPRWRDYMASHESLLQSLGKGAIQFSHLNDSYYTNVSWAYQPMSSSTSGGASGQRISTNFEKGIARATVFRSHVDKTNEVLVQDSSLHVSLVSSAGKVLWKLQLEDYIQGDIHQVDFFNNGKLQFLFATPGKLHVIDRVGNYVDHYPMAIAPRDIEYLSVVDYDHSKKYRFLLAEKNGKLWMYDKEGHNLDGWRPRLLDEGLSTTPQHHRILGKDYVIAIRKDGFVYMMNRRGELLKNFPLDLNARPTGGYHVNFGKQRSSTVFTVVSRDGLRIQFNLDGKMVNREPLLKNVADAQFALVAESQGQGYLILRQEGKQMSLLDESLNTLVISDFIGNNAMDVRYEDLGGGKVYIVVQDRVQELTFIYDGKGTLLTTLPIESQYLWVRMADQMPLIFFTLGQNLTIQPLR